MTSLFSWGISSNGQLGLGNTEEESIFHPRRVLNLKNEDVAQISSGFRHCLILMKGGSVYACGANDFGQLGLSASQHGNKVSSPTQITSLETQQINTVCCGGDDFSIAINDRGQVFSWGKNIYGQTGRPNPETGPYQLPIKLVRHLANHRVVGISCGKWHTVVLTDESHVFTWGSNSDGQLGIGNKDVKFLDQPERLTTLSYLPIRLVSAGGRHSFCLTISRVLFSWGCNEDGQLGLGNKDNQYKPHQLKSLRALQVADVSCGERHTAVLTLKGAIFTFGDSSYGQLGHGRSTKKTLLPKQVNELMGSSANQVVCGRLHTLVLLSADRKLYSFGHGAHGQLGVGHADDRDIPVAVKSEWLGEGGVRLELHWIAAGGNASFLFGRPCDKALPPGQQDYHTIPLNTIDDLTVNELTSVYEPVEKIESIIRSVPSLLASFTDEEHENPSPTTHGVDLDKVIEKTEIMLQNCPDEECTGDSPHVKRLLRLRGELECLIANLEPKYMLDTECLRLALILLASAFFMKPKMFGRIICKFCHFVSRLDTALLTEVLVPWFSLLLPRHMKRIVVGLKECLRMVFELDDEIKDRHFVVDNCDPRVLILTVLAMLHNGNTTNQPIVPNELFYFSNLKDYVNIVDDYTIYLRHRALGGPSNQYFFCNFTFIYDGFAKKELLEVAFLKEKINAANEGDDRISVWRIRRSHIITDTLATLDYLTSTDIKKHMRVEFDNEDGIDEGGLRKEYFLLLFREILDPQYGMFKLYKESRMIWFNPVANMFHEGTEMFEMIGKICGIAVYNFTLVNLNFPMALFKKLLGKPVVLDDLKELDPTLGKSLQDILDYDGPQPMEDVFCLKYEITEELIGDIQTVPLCNNGSEISVTEQNRENYVSLYVDYIFNRSCQEQYIAFAHGFNQACSCQALRLFEPKELLAVVEGSENYDWNTLEENVVYEGGLSENHHLIIWFWQVFREMKETDKRRFLLFLTGSDRVPLVGMSGIQLIFSSYNQGDNYYPVAHTCSSELDIPIGYSSKEVLRNRLLTAIQCEGFGLI